MFENHGYWTIGDYLLRHREIYHITQTDMARQLGISPQYLSDIEKNRRVPSEDLLIKIATEMPFDEDFLFSVIGRFSPKTLALMMKLPTHIVANCLGRFLRELNEYAYGHLDECER